MRAPPALRGGLGFRFVLLAVGLVLFAAGVVALLQARLGLPPWDVLHQGIAEHTRLEAFRYLLAVPRSEFRLLADPDQQAALLDGYLRQLPHEDIVYLGDTARVPYGTRGRQTILNYSHACASVLREQRIKLLVTACNTVSAIALEQLQA